MASDDVISQRLVHFVDESKRSELMIVYIEELSSPGLTAADLAPKGKAYSQWPEISNGILRRALNGIKLKP
jgi:hypothetical protein